MPRPKRTPDAPAHDTPAPTTRQRPAATIRDGNLKLVLWKNESDKGPWYNADLIRTFQTESGYQETSKVPASDLLRVAFLAQQAYGDYLELRAQDKADQAANPSSYEPG